MDLRTRAYRRGCPAARRGCHRNGGAIYPLPLFQHSNQPAGGRRRSRTVREVCLHRFARERFRIHWLPGRSVHRQHGISHLLFRSDRTFRAGEGAGIHDLRPLGVRDADRSAAHTASGGGGHASGSTAAPCSTASAASAASACAASARCRTAYDFGAAASSAAPGCHTTCGCGSSTAGRTASGCRTASRFGPSTARRTATSGRSPGPTPATSATCIPSAVGATGGSATPCPGTTATSASSASSAAAAGAKPPDHHPVAIPLCGAAVLTRRVGACLSYGRLPVHPCMNAAMESTLELVTSDEGIH